MMTIALQTIASIMYVDMLISRRIMKISAKWLWAILIVIFLSFGIRIENAFLEDARNIIGLIVFVVAVKTFFFSRKNK
jgi:hypothetical protein